MDDHRDSAERQKDAEERLRKSEARYRSLIQGAAYGIYRAAFDGAILDANPALARMLGYDSPEELMSHNMRDLYPTSAERVDLVERFGRQRYGAADVHWLRKDGTPILVRVSARIVEVEDGVSGFEGIAEDITAKRALEEQLRQAQKMEAVGRLARGVAHDFNNVLAAIIGCSDLLGLKLERDHPAQEEAEDIRKAAERGVALTRQLLTFSRSQAAEVQLLDLNVLVSQLATVLQRLAGDRVALQIHASETPALASVEPGQFEQILMNLTVNARDAMPEGGTIDIEVGPIDLDERSVVRYPGIPAGSYARVAVRDSGVGIDPAAQAHIFEPFFTTKVALKGTGLGLSLVYGIVKGFGGTITFSTGVNRGTTFEVLLPLLS